MLVLFLRILLLINSQNCVFCILLNIFAYKQVVNSLVELSRFYKENNQLIGSIAQEFLKVC